MTWAFARLASYLAVLGIAAWLTPRPTARLLETEDAKIGGTTINGHAPTPPDNSTDDPSTSDALPGIAASDTDANLLAMVSHDLRTPLTSVKGFAQLLLRDRTASEASRRYAEVILAETNRTIRTIDDVADLARLAEGHYDLDIRPVDLAPIVLRAVESVRHQDVEGRLRLAVPDSLPEVPADASRIERIVTNLVSAALRYSPGSDPIEVGAAGCDGSVEVWVRDRGAGIPIEKYAHVFDLGPSSNGTGGTGGTGGNGDRDEGRNGSGLGLFISKRLVEAQGGKIWVEQEADRGRGFRFRLTAPI